MPCGWLECAPRDRADSLGGAESAKFTEKRTVSVGEVGQAASIFVYLNDIMRAPDGSVHTILMERLFCISKSAGGLFVVRITRTDTMRPPHILGAE